MSGKILVVGNGMLGSQILQELPNTIRYRKDITEAFEIDKDIEIIIHTAAWTDVDGCEKDVDKAYKVNVLGTQNLVNYCIDKDILFIYISSTGVYGTSKEEEYTEYDEAIPTTVHHKSKYEGELVVKNHLTKYVILRTGWLYGGDKNHTKNFVYKRFLEAIQKNTIYSDNTQIGNPTNIYDLIKQIEVLIKNKQYGLFNCINEGHDVSRFDYVNKIVELFDIDCRVQIAPKGMFQRIAPVSFNESAKNYKLDLLGLNIMGKWETSLEKYIDQLKSEM